VNIARLLHLLETEASDSAIAAMEQPAGREAFDYGRAVGMYAGLRRAFEVIANAQSEEEAHGRDL
jgi:hypothetical protein